MVTLKLPTFPKNRFFVHISSFAFFTCFNSHDELGLRKDKGGNNEIFN